MTRPTEAIATTAKLLIDDDEDDDFFCVRHCR